MLGRQTGRKALVVFTDGEDQGSHVDDRRRRAPAAGERRDALHDRPGPRRHARSYLKKIMQRLTVPTGGRAFSTDSIDELHGAFDELLDELSNQYLLGYQPTNTKRDDTWREDQGRGRRPPRRPRAPGLSRDCRANERCDDREARRSRQRSSLSVRLCVLCVLAVLSCRCAQQPPAPPRFQSSVEVTSIDVTVVDDRGKPIADLTAGRLHRAHRRQRAARRHAPNGCRSTRRAAARRAAAARRLHAPTRTRPAAG